MGDRSAKADHLPTDSLDTNGLDIGAVEVIDGPQGNGDSASVVAEEDDIGPDDAPEVALENIVEEENVPSMMGQLGQPQTAAEAIKAMKKRQANEVLLSLGTLCILGDEKAKATAPEQSHDRNKKKKQQKPKKKKDRRLIEDGIRRMCATGSNVASSCSQAVSREAVALSKPEEFCNSTADEPGQSDSHQYQHIDLGALGTSNFQKDGPHASRARATESQSRPLSPNVWRAPIKSPSAPEQFQPFPPSADDCDTDRSTISEKLTITNGLETGTLDGEATQPAAAPVDSTGHVSAEGVDLSADLNLPCDREYPFVEGQSDGSGPYLHTSAVETDATQLPLAQREGGQVVTEVATLRFGLPANGSMNWCLRSSHDLDMEEDEVEIEGDFSIPMSMDEDEDESEPRLFSVLPDTTFDPSPAYHLHPYSHNLNIRQDGLVGDDNGLADLAMEDAGMEAWEGTASLTATHSLQPFSWISPFVSSTPHANFPGVPSGQTVALVNGPMHESPMLGSSCAVDATISEGVVLPHAAPPQDIAWPFVPNGTTPSPFVEVGLFKRPNHFIPTLSEVPVSNIFTSLATDHSAFPSTLPSESRPDPIPVPLSACRPTGEHQGDFKGPNREVGPDPAVSASFRHEALPLGSLCVRKATSINSDASQLPTPPAADPNTSLSPSLYPPTFGTTVVSDSSPSFAIQIERNEIEIEHKDGAKDGHSEVVHEIFYTALAIAQSTAEKSPPPRDPVATVKPPPPVPPRIVGSKRKFVEDRSTYCNSINPARKISKPRRSKKQKIEHGEYSTHKRLEEVKAMHRRGL